MNFIAMIVGIYGITIETEEIQKHIVLEIENKKIQNYMVYYLAVHINQKLYL